MRRLILGVAALALIGAAAGCRAHHGSYTELTWRASPTGQRPLTDADFDEAASIMRSRLSKLGAHGKVSVDESAGLQA